MHTTKKLVIISFLILSAISSKVYSDPVRLYVPHTKDIIGIEITNEFNEIQIKKRVIETLKNMQQTIYLKQQTGVIVEDNRDILWIEERNKTTVFDGSEIRNNPEFYTFIKLSGISPNEKNLMFFIDRRIPEEKLPPDEFRFESPILYPDQDTVSGFYVLDVTTKETKQLKFSGNFLAWINNKDILISNESPSIFEDTPKEIHYYVFDIVNNNILATVNMTQSQQLIINKENTPDRLIGIGKPLDSTNYDLIAINKENLSLETIKKGIDPSLGNTIKASPFDQKILSIDSTINKNNFTENIITTAIYIDGTLHSIIHLEPILDADWFNKDDIIMASNHTLYLYNLSTRTVTSLPIE